MQEFNESVMVVLIPTTSYWCKKPSPHMTLVYAGKIPNLKTGDFNKLAKDGSMLALISRPITLEVSEVSIFGDNEEAVDVFSLTPNTELLAMRHFLEHWNASIHDFNPHTTIGPMGSFSGMIPKRLSFDKLLVSWGNENLTFRLHNGY